MIDWMEHVQASSQNNEYGILRLGKGSRAFRIIRMVRLLRLIRMREVLGRALERVQSEWLTIFSDIMRIVVIIVGYSHLIACVWWGIGNMHKSSNYHSAWVKVHGFDQ